MIAESEMILNDRGAIYHIDLRPEEMADTIITVGDPARVEEISKYFDTIEVKRSHREFVSHTGYVGSKRITVVSTGIGPDNIDIVLNELDALANVHFPSRTISPQHRSLTIIRLGTSGSLQPHFDVDSLVLGTMGLGLDNLLYFYNNESTVEERQILEQFLSQTHLTGEFAPYLVRCSEDLLKTFSKEFHQQGITVTCPGFYGPQGRHLRIPIAHPHLVWHMAAFKFGHHIIANFEMETSAIYGLGKLMGHKCLSLNVIVANRMTQRFTQDGKKAVENLIQKALPVIETL